MAERARITVVPPEGETVAVDILEDDVSLGTVHAERATTRMLTLPLSITERTSFFVPAGTGPYDVSVKLGDDEIAGPGGAPVTVSTFPAEIRARVDAAELGSVAGSGGSSHGDPCWFGNQSGQALTADVTYRVPWTDLLDGVPAATDLRPDADTLKCVTPGLYMVSVTLMVNALDGSGVTGAFSIMDYNDDSAGPLYYLEPIEVVKDIADPAGTQYRHIYPPAPIELAVDDILWAEVNALGGNAALGGCYFHATRLG